MSSDDKTKLIEAVVESLDFHSDKDDLNALEKARFAELWDEGLASGPGENFTIGELISAARSSPTENVTGE